MNFLVNPLHGVPRLVLCLVLLGCAGGCPRRGAETGNGEAGRPFEGQVVEVVIPAGTGLRERWQLLLEEWAERTGAAHTMVESPPDGPQTLSERLAGDAPPSGGRLLVFPITDIAELADRGLLTPVPDPERLDWSDLFQGLRENVASVERRPMVVPVSSPVLVCYYRRDLLEAAGLSPPQTWDDYQALLDSLDRWAPGLTAVEPWHPEWRATTFLARAVAFAKHPANLSLFFDIETGEPLIDGPGFVRGLEASLQAVRLLPDDVTDYTPADCRREFLAGRAALALSFETGPDGSPLAFGPGGSGEPAAGTARSGDHDGSEPGAVGRAAAMSAGFVRLPGAREVFNRSTGSWDRFPEERLNRPTLTAFAGLCVGVAEGDGSDASWNLLGSLAVDQAASAFPEGTRSVCRQSQLYDAALWTGRELTAAEAGAFVSATAAALRETHLVAELPAVGRQRFRDALSEGLEPVLAGSVGPQEGLQGIAAHWRELAGELGADGVRDSYRRSLGLRPAVTAP